MHQVKNYQVKRCAGMEVYGLTAQSIERLGANRKPLKPLPAPRGYWFTDGLLVKIPRMQVTTFLQGKFINHCRVIAAAMVFSSANSSGVLPQ